MKNEKVSLRLSRIPLGDKISLAEEIINCMNGNPLFPGPLPSLASLSAAKNNLQHEHLKVLAGDKSRLSQRHACENILDNLLLQLGNYVEGLANAAALNGEDAKSIIAAAGMPYKKDKSAHPAPPAPGRISARSTGIEGEIELVWDCVADALVYIIESSTDTALVSPGAPGRTENLQWLQQKITPRHKHVLKGLNSGTRYAFRVWCIGRNGDSPYSTVVIAKVL